MSSVKLPGLTALRFLAAFSVLFGHIEQFKSWAGFPMLHPAWLFGQPSYSILDRLFSRVPADGVKFFFVLSGFLITYLLFQEQEKTGTVAIGKFYVRRVLRIWPLYYFIVFIGLIVAPLMEINLPPKFVDGWPDFWPRLMLFLLFLPKAGRDLYPEVTSTGHLWSIGVEETFYLTWPWVIKKLKKYSIFLMVAILAGTTAITAAPGFFDRIQMHQMPLFQLLERLFAFFSFQFLALGAIGAWIAVYKPAWCKVLFHPVVQAITYLLVIKHLIYFDFYGRWDDLGYGIPDLLLIMNVALNPKTWFRFENKVLTWLGERSYGIYMYQFICIHVLVLLINWFGRFESQLWNDLYLYVGSISLTIGCAAVSYRWMEKPFLSLRNRFSWFNVPKPILGRELQ